jgi:hypothetical protein
MANSGVDNNGASPGGPPNNKNHDEEQDFGHHVELAGRGGGFGSHWQGQLDGLARIGLVGSICRWHGADDGQIGRTTLQKGCHSHGVARCGSLVGGIARNHGSLDSKVERDSVQCHQIVDHEWQRFGGGIIAAALVALYRGGAPLESSSSSTTYAMSLLQTAERHVVDPVDCCLVDCGWLSLIVACNVHRCAFRASVTALVVRETGIR